MKGDWAGRTYWGAAGSPGHSRLPFAGGSLWAALGPGTAHTPVGNGWHLWESCLGMRSLAEALARVVLLWARQEGIVWAYLRAEAGTVSKGPLKSFHWLSWAGLHLVWVHQLQNWGPGPVGPEGLHFVH